MIADLGEIRVLDRPVAPEHPKVAVGLQGADFIRIQDHALVVEERRQDEQSDLDGVEDSVEDLGRDDPPHQLGDTEEMDLVVQRVLGMQRRERLHTQRRLIADLNQVHRQSLGQVLVLRPHEPRPETADQSRLPQVVPRTHRDRPPASIATVVCWISAWRHACTMAL